MRTHTNRGNNAEIEANDLTQHLVWTQIDPVFTQQACIDVVRDIALDEAKKLPKRAQNGDNQLSCSVDDLIGHATAGRGWVRDEGTSQSSGFFLWSRG